MQAVEISYTEIQKPETEPRLGLIERIEKRKALLIVILVVLGLGVRAYRLDSASLSEDETNKVFAVRAYDQGDFTANSEHPMIMKMLCFASIKASELFNGLVGPSWSISEETALRLPNATFGALTVIPLFLFTVSLFGFRVGLVTALLWTLGLNSVWINRVVKEDTLLVFFMFMAFYLFNCARQRSASDISGQERLYALTGAAFGMMMASKYLPHYFGLMVLFYHVAGYDSRNNRPRTKRMTLTFFGSMLLAFVVFNPALFSPQTWRFLSHYSKFELLSHHGYLLGQTLYDNVMTAMPNGNAWYFYFLFLGIKVPIPLLIAFIIGLVEIFRHRGPEGQERGYLFLRLMLVFWLFPMAFAGSKFLRYTLSLMPLLYMTAAIAIVMIWKFLAPALARSTLTQRKAAIVSAVAVGAFFIATPTVSLIASLPTPSLYLNSFGGNRIGYFFPHDEFYDLGARESIEYVAKSAPRGALIASEIPGVVQYYLEKYDRTDIRSEIISHPDFSIERDQPAYVLLQRGRVYFENQNIFKEIERQYPLVQASSYGGADACRVYKVGGQAAQGSTTEPNQRPFLY
ncbi:MAG TPA: glycosyltransferase family 39 protein [Blastocatellia bacterium]|nr:glycosyltransferase family 39 protein [Blastocatellia bacterium]